MRRWSCFAGFAAAVLSGCASAPVQEVRVPVPVPCVTAAPPHADSVLDRLPLDAALYDQVQALLADRKLADAYAGQLEALLAACR